MFKKWKKIAIECSAAALLMSTLFTASFAWFTAQNKADLGDGEGFTAAAYFDGGNGSEENPYIINRPIHLYNLAWLQYLGYFNKTDGSGNLIQKHFVLTGDLDMAGWTLPAIGTTDNPFMGTFTGDPGDQSGNYYVVKNLTVDNQLGEGHIDHKPSVVTSLTGVNIVGMFGVVGNYEGLYSASTFSTAANFIQDFYLDQATIHSQLSATLMGVAAGYVNAPVAGVGVSNSKLNVAPGSDKFRADLTSNISDYTTIGYCTADYKGTRSIRKTNVQAGTTGSYYFSSLSSGASDAWGGSIDFSSVYSRLKIYQRDSSANSNTLNTSGWISSETQTIDGTTTTVTNQVAYPAGQIKNYYDSSTPLKGSYSFDYYSSGTLEAGTSDSSYDYIYLYGKKTWTKTTTTRQVNSGSSYAISYGSNYLIPSGTSGVTNTTTLTYSWKFSNFSGSGTISTVIGSTTYYLKYGSASGTRYLLAIGTSSPTTWTRTGNLTTTTIGGRAYYLEYSTTYGWDLSRTSMNLVYSPSSTTNTVQTTTLGETNDTYFPLNVGSDGLPADTNTGYIIGGSTYNASTYYKSGDSRVSRYFMSDIYKSLDGTSSSATFDPTKFEILSQTSSSGLVRVKDDVGTGNNPSPTTHTPTSTELSSKTGYLYSDLGLQKYKNSRKSLDNVLGASTNTYGAIYGMHFMDASISNTNKVTVPRARISRKDYSNYEMPRDAVDFNLQEKGFINFFAGTYFSGNNSFFSLHKIERTTASDLSSSTITSIKEISKIYAPTPAYLQTNPTAPYIYSFWNDSGHTSETQASAPANYALKFNMSWVTSPTMITNAVYYYEIPVNDGEYALGSVPGTNGAYLLYLDISANAQPISRTVVTEYIVTISASYQYPKGIQVVADPAAGKSAIDDLNSAAAALIGGSYSGAFTIARSSNVVAFTTDNVNFSPGFKGDSVTLAGFTTSGGNLTVPNLVPISPATTNYIKRMTYIDYNMALTTTTKTIFTSTDGTMTYSHIDAEGVVTTPTNTIDNSGELINVNTIVDSSINTGALAGTQASYWYSFFASQTSVTAQTSFTYTLASGTIGADQGMIASISTYTITLTSMGETLIIHVDLLAATYSVVLNGTTVATGPINV